MRSLLSRPPRSLDQWIETGIQVGILGLLSGIFLVEHIRVWPNIALAALLISALAHALRTRPPFWQSLREPPFWAYMAIYVLLAFSMVFTAQTNVGYATGQLEMKVLFVVLPLAFALLPALTARTYQRYLLAFVAMTLLTSFFSLRDYFLHREEVLQAYGRAGIMFTVTHHVRYSVLVCYALFCSGYLAQQASSLFKRIIFLAVTCFFVLFLHILAVRTGLICFYALAAWLALRQLGRQKRWVGALLLLVILGTAVVAFTRLETLQKRVEYTLYDLEQYQNDPASANNYSMARRLLAYQVAWDTFRANPLFGVGEGNVQAALQERYRQEHTYITPDNYLMPHNEFLRFMAAEGLVGLGGFLFLFYYPWLSGRRYRFLPLSAFYLVITLSMLFEDALNTQLGLYIGLLFPMLHLTYLRGEAAHT
ncbi:O-antigen ligase [Catalinimonas alkaloidigena]|uniref:O-antigen ligase n=1 Tax=Catalinimonas alkaloidigena TaxID=1075417 RepID=A0A1G9BQM9_9BACT|nr:O-antigen ligase family protein [Catalinimonas alkaloidigena]SDK41799.1 O-antigen ligase [Catalinimonas alkaloidigena]